MKATYLDYLLADEGLRIVVVIQVLMRGMLFSAKMGLQMVESLAVYLAIAMVDATVEMKVKMRVAETTVWRMAISPDLKVMRLAESREVDMSALLKSALMGFAKAVESEVVLTG